MISVTSTPPMVTSNRCQVCEKSGLATSAFQAPRKASKTAEYNIEYSTLLAVSNSLRGTLCAFCRLILTRLPATRLLCPRSETTKLQVVLRDSSRLHHSGHAGGEKRLTVLVDDRNCGSLRTIQTPVLSTQRPTGDDSRIDFGQLRGWLDNCETHHGEDCNLWAYATARYRLPIDILLIDVVNNCLVEAESDWRFIALSYVWGSVNMFETTEENFASLQLPGSLGSHSSLPATIRDAFLLVRKLGERYLWIDRLCIKQNSRGKHRDLARMDVVYSHALFTIAAIDGKHANDSLPGVQPASRLPIRRIEAIQDATFISDPPPLQRFLTGSVYETRGWTYQERCFSRRILFFSHQQVYFQCQKHVRSESHPQEKPFWSASSRVNKIRLRGSWKVDISSFGSMSNDKIPPEHWTTGLPIYQDLVEDYSRRKLTFTTDVVNAFAGFNSIFEECCGGAIISAMPVSTLSSALMWVAMAGTRRRKQGGAPIFSSWCWAGWEGSVKYPTVMRKTSPTTSFSRLENAIIYTSSAPDEVPEGYEDLSTVNKPVISVQPCNRFKNKLLPTIDMLTFTAPTLSLNMFELKPGRSSNRCVPYYTFSRKGQTNLCGVFFGISSMDVCTTEIKRMEIVLVSHDFDPSSRAQLRASYGLSCPADLSPGRELIKHTLDILLVQNCGGNYERVAVGKMCSEFWGAQDLRRNIALA